MKLLFTVLTALLFCTLLKAQMAQGTPGGQRTAHPIT